MRDLYLLALHAVSAFAQSSSSGFSEGGSSTKSSTATITAGPSMITTTADVDLSKSTTPWNVTLSMSLTDPAYITQYVYGLANTGVIYGASVIAADQLSTTYLENCVSGPIDVCFDDDATVTLGATSLRLINTIVNPDDGTTVSELVTCIIFGTTSTSCLLSQGQEFGDTTTAVFFSTSSSGTNLPFATFVITAGQEKLLAASTVVPTDTTVPPPISSFDESTTSSSSHRGSGNAASRVNVMLSSTAHTGLLMGFWCFAGTVFAFAVFL